MMTKISNEINQFLMHQKLGFIATVYQNNTPKCLSKRNNHDKRSCYYTNRRFGEIPTPLSNLGYSEDEIKERWKKHYLSV